MYLSRKFSAQIHYAPNRLSAGASPGPHCGSFQRSPRPSSWFGGEAPPGMGGKGKEGRRERGGGEGKGEGKGKRRGIAPQSPNRAEALDEGWVIGSWVISFAAADNKEACLDKYC